MLYDPRWTADPISRTLRRAADMIERQGWCQGQWADKHGRVCIMGALGDTESDPAAFCAACHRLSTHLGQRLSMWNDEPGRTKDEVLAMLRSL